jgi:hypothetical protein
MYFTVILLILVSKTLLKEVKKLQNSYSVFGKLGKVDPNFVHGYIRILKQYSHTVILIPFGFALVEGCT